MTRESGAFGLSSGDRSRMGEVQRLAAEGAGGLFELVALLSEPSWVIRRAVVASLGRLGPVAVPPLLASLAADRTNESRIAATVDALVASSADPTAAIFAAAQQTSEPAVLCDFAQILGRRKSRAAVDTLARWSVHSDDNLAVAALEALGRIGGPSVLEPLLAAARSQSFFRTFPAITMLGQLGDPRSVGPLAALLDDPLYGIEAAQALGRSGQLSAIAPLARHLGESGDEAVRAAATALLALRQGRATTASDDDAFMRTFESAVAPNEATARVRVSEALRAADPSARVALATVLSWLKSDAAIATLISLVEDEDAAVAEHALRTLRGMRERAEPQLRSAVRLGSSRTRAKLLPLLGARRAVLSELVQCLADADSAVRTQACEALGRVGDTSVVDPLFGLLTDPDPRVAQAALGAIQSLGSHEVKARALDAARSLDHRLRHSALRIVSYFGYPEALDLLLEAVVDPDDRVRDAAMFGLALLDEPRAEDALLAASRHVHAATRAAACRALGRASVTPATVHALTICLADPDPWVRYYACQALGRLHATSATPRIEMLVDDVAGQVRVAAVEAIAQLGGAQALTLLTVAAGSPDPDVRRSAIQGLGAIRRPEALPLLLSAIESADAATRVVALTSLSTSPAPEALAALMDACVDTDERVRSAAFFLLSGRGGTHVTQWLVELLGRDDTRQGALGALAHPADGRIEGMLRSLETASATLSPLVVQALLAMRRADGNAAVLAALHMNNVHARRAAAVALASLDTPDAREALNLAAELDADEELRRICAAAAPLA